MSVRRVMQGRRPIAIAVAIALMGPMGVSARPFSSANAGSPDPAVASTDLVAQSRQGPASSSTAATDLGAITVTANKRRERLQDVPMAVSALPGYQLQRESAVSFTDYMARVPGANIISFSPGQNQLVLRGVTSGADTANATVGTYIDDVPFGSSTVYAAGSALTPDLDPDDVERIEVLRGPQGTLYGSNTLGGLLKFVTTPPDSTQFYGRANLGLSSIAHGGTGHQAHVTLNVPLVKDKLAARVNLYDRDDPGYTDNVLIGRKDIDEVKVTGGRAQLLWTPTDKVSLRLTALAQNLSTHGASGTEIDPDTRRPIHGYYQNTGAAGTGWFNIKYRLYAAALNADFGWARLVSTTSYSSLDKHENVDASKSYGPLLNPMLGLPDTVGYSVLNPITLGKFTQEIRLQSPQQQAVEWRVGVFYTREHTSNTQDVLSFDASTGTPVDLPLTLAHLKVGPSFFKEWAGYGDVTWHASDRFSILLGARYTSDRTQYTQKGDGALTGPSDFTTHSKDTSTTFLLNPSFRFNDDAMAYVRIASGFRPGGANVGVPPGLGAPLTFDPDKLVSYELGLKTTAADRHMTFDVAAFYIDWTRIQLTSFAGGFSFLGNGGKASSQGLEASWQYAPVSGLVLSANATWTDAKLTQDTPYPLFGYTGERLPYVPKWNANLGFDYDFALGGDWSAFVGASFQHIGARKTDFPAGDPSPRYTLASYNSIDLRAGVNYGSWTFKAYVKNLTDQRGITTMSSETLTATASPFSANYLQPRLIGVSATVDF